MNTFGLFAVNSETAADAPELFGSDHTMSPTWVSGGLRLFHFYVSTSVLIPQFRKPVSIIRGASGFSLAAATHFYGDFKGEHKSFYREMRYTGMAQLLRGALEYFPEASPLVTLGDIIGTGFNLWTLRQSRTSLFQLGMTSRRAIRIFTGVAPIVLAYYPGNSVQDIRKLATLARDLYSKFK